MSEEKAYFSIEGIHYLTGKPVRLEIIDGLIGKVTEIDLQDKRSNNLYIAPGLIDNQINGYVNVDFSGNNLSVQDLLTAAKSIWKDGVTSFLPTLVTNSNDNLLRNFKILAESIRKDKQLSESIPGFHLEGPYISPDEGFRGAHPPKYIRKPSFEEFMRFQEAAGGRIIQITIAPELEGAMDFIGSCSRAGVAVAIGHTNASADQILQAVECGAKLSTHLGNGCANLINRHKNPLWPQLANDQLTPSIIADGHHLTPEEIRVFYKVKGPDNIILTSDVIFLAGMATGKYTFLESEVHLTSEGMIINTELNCLAGASFPLIKGVENIMNFTGCSLTKAINMASVNVARIYSLSNRGELTVGKRADIIQFERNRNELIIKKTLLNGITVFQE